MSLLTLAALSKSAFELQSEDYSLCTDLGAVAVQGVQLEELVSVLNTPISCDH